MIPAVPPFLVKLFGLTLLNRYGKEIIFDTLGSDNGAPPSAPTWFLSVRAAAPESIQPLRQTPAHTLPGSLLLRFEAYYSRSQLLGVISILNF
jgi:hypothetical protein